MKYKIREISVSDIPVVQNVAKLSWHDTYEGIIPRHIQENFLDIAYSTSMLEKEISDDSNVCGRIFRESYWVC